MVNRLMEASGELQSLLGDVSDLHNIAELVLTHLSSELKAHGRFLALLRSSMVHKSFYG